VSRDGGHLRQLPAERQPERDRPADRRAGAALRVASAFRDLEAIESGMDFERAILDALRAATVVLAVIGRAWVSAVAATGSRRLDDPADYVRREIETALAEGMDVIPVLVEGVAMPTAEELPLPIRALARHQAFELSERRWAYDVGQLAAQLELRMGIEPLEAQAALEDVRQLALPSGRLRSRARRCAAGLRGDRSGRRATGGTPSACSTPSSRARGTSDV